MSIPAWDFAGADARSAEGPHAPKAAAGRVARRQEGQSGQNIKADAHRRALLGGLHPGRAQACPPGDWGNRNSRGCSTNDRRSRNREQAAGYADAADEAEAHIGRNSAPAIKGVEGRGPAPYEKSAATGAAGDVRCGTPRLRRTGGLLRRAARGRTRKGHDRRELAGLVLEQPFPIDPQGVPPEVLGPFEREAGKPVLCNKPCSGTDVIADYGREHCETGRPIVYTSADSVFQIAAHVDAIPPSAFMRSAGTRAVFCRARTPSAA